MGRPAVLLAAFACSTAVAAAAPPARPAGRDLLESAARLELHGVAADVVAHGGRRAVRLRERPEAEGEAIAVVPGIALRDGAIDIDLAGQPRAGAREGARGFVGVAFRVAPDASRFECFYLRPTNGRAGDQLRRNHATQYISFPDFPWEKLRKDAPGVYESYVDLVPGAWTPVRITFADSQARLYVHGASQPTLLVDDLKLPPASGGVALWIGSGTEAWFSNLRVRPAPETPAPASPARPGR